MKNKFIYGALAALALCAQASAEEAEVGLLRFDCGTSPGPSDVAAFSDTFAYDGKKLLLTYSCYLIRHGKEYLVWDTGQPVAVPGVKAMGATAKVSLVDQLAQLKLKIEDIKYVGISHYHFDHTAQLGSFTQSTLLIGKGDWDAVKQASSTPMRGLNATPFEYWSSGKGKVEPVDGDKDIFGDQTVRIINTPGHTPGHHSLLVKLKKKGYVMLTGDLAHFQENYESNGVPQFNTHRGDTLASFDRFKKMAGNLKATVIIQHDPRDIDKLPVFPAFAE